MKQTALIRLLILTNIALLIVAAAPRQPKVLTVSEVDVVDAKGVIRARLGGDLPDAVVNGKVLHRGSKAAGLMLYDETGEERGGYVTHTPGSLVTLSIDSRNPRQQIATLVGGPTGESALMLNWNDDIVEMRADTEMGPSFHAKRGKQVVFHVPSAAGFEKGEACGELRGALKSMPREKVLDFCRARTSEDACQACLGGQ
jgi:hypothetical protein